MVNDRDIDKNAGVAEEVIAFPFDDVGIGVSDGLRGSFKPGYAFEVVGVQHFVRDITATFSYMVKIGTTNALASAATPADATRGDATLHGTRANILGDADDVINVHLTTDGSGAAEEGCVYVVIRPRPMAGDPDPVL